MAQGDVFEIIYRTSQTEGSSGVAPAAPSDMSWSNVNNKPFSSIGARLSVANNALRADLQSWSEITGKPSTFPPAPHTHEWSAVTDKPFSTLGDSLKETGGALDTDGITDNFELASGEILVVEKGLIVDVILPES